MKDNITSNAIRINDLLADTIKLIEFEASKPDSINGIPSGFKELDIITSGFQKSQLIIVGGRPSMGKTAFTLNVLKNIAVDHNIPVALFSMESDSISTTTRLIATETMIGSERIRSGKLKDEEWALIKKTTKQLSDAPIYIDDTPNLNTTILRNKCIKLKEEHNIKCFFVDYLQLMRADPLMRGNLEQDINQISRELKRLARELDIPFIVNSQLNRFIEGRTGDAKKPILSDLRDSGALEEDADLVIFIHRPERYGIMQDVEGNSLEGIADIIIAKHRQGATGELQLQFTNNIAKFTDVEKIPQFSQGDIDVVDDYSQF